MHPSRASDFGVLQQTIGFRVEDAAILNQGMHCYLYFEFQVALCRYIIVVDIFFSQSRITV